MEENSAKVQGNFNKLKQPTHVTNHEVQLLFHILRQPLQCDDQQCMKPTSEIVNKLDVDKFFDLVLRNGLAGIIYLQNQQTEILPTEITDKLKVRYRQTALSNLGQLGELLEILKIFKEHATELITLKGVMDAELLFGDLGSYPSSDIDVLVHEQELPALCQMLNQYGYYAIENIDEHDLLTSHYHLIYRKKNACIELHWNLVKRYFDVPGSFWWEGTTERIYRERAIQELATEKYLLYLIFRLFDHQFTPFKFWVHISAFIANSKHLDWDKLISYSELFHMEKLVIFTLQLVNEFFSTQISDNISTKKVRGYRFLRNLVLAQNFSKTCKPHIATLYFTCFLLPSQQSAKILFSRIFPTSAEIRLRYHLKTHSKTVYIYMIFNPILMLLRKK